MINDRRSTRVQLKLLPRFGCGHCVFSSYDPDLTLGHMFATHINRRVQTISPNPGRRSTDHSPAIQRFMEARDRGEGLGRPH